MRLDNRYLDCVVLLGLESGTKFDTWGCGFIVISNRSRRIFLVTAEHVYSNKPYPQIYIRFRNKTGNAQSLRIDNPSWIKHPTDSTIDLSVLELDVPDWVDYKPLAKSPNLNESRRLKKKNIGIGNRTYTLGLWKYNENDGLHSLFVYTGHIGMMYGPVRVKPWRKDQTAPISVEAYLIEGEPLDGTSGAPVFVRRSIPCKITELDAKTLTKPLRGFIEGSAWLLGLHSDAFVAKPSSDYKPSKNKGDIVPRGVNVVIPTHKIVEVLDHAETLPAPAKAPSKKP